MRGESGELVFLRYAHSVIGYCNDDKVGVEELEKFTEMLKTGRGKIDRGRLEQLFPDAVKHLKSWGSEDVRDYWLKGHNQVSDVEVNPLCKVYLRRVEDIHLDKGDGVSRIEVNGMGSATPRSYIPLDVGNLVSIHAFQVAERLSQSLVEKYSSGLE